MISIEKKKRPYITASDCWVAVDGFVLVSAIGRLERRIKQTTAELGEGRRASLLVQYRLAVLRLYVNAP